MGNHINKTFDQVYCLNLKKRVDRWAQCIEQFDKQGIDVVRFGAIDGNLLSKEILQNIQHKNKSNVSHLPGHVGCNLSHLSILKHATEQQYDNILVLEDDAVLHPEFCAMFKKYYQQLPNDWIMCYLGGNYLEVDPRSGRTNGRPGPAQGQMVTDNIRQCRNLFTTTGYILNKEGIKICLKGLELNNCAVAVDEYYVKLQSVHNIYIFEPRLVYQRPGHSDILNGFRDYKTMQDF